MLPAHLGDHGSPGNRWALLWVLSEVEIQLNGQVSWLYYLLSWPDHGWRGQISLICPHWFQFILPLQLIILYFMCIGVCHGCEVPWNLSYRQLWAAMWVLGVEPWSSGIAGSALNLQVISPAPPVYFFRPYFVPALFCSFSLSFLPLDWLSRQMIMFSSSRKPQSLLASYLCKV